MARRSKEEEREERIPREIIADAYGPEEQATSWYTYLAETLRFPFPAHCTALRAISPLEQAMNLMCWASLRKRSVSMKCSC